MWLKLQAAIVTAGFLLGSTAVDAADLGGDCCADLEERVAELEATTARKGNRKVSLTVYGHVNHAVMAWDDGTEDDVYVVTNSTTKSIVGFEGRASITPKISAGYRLEIEYLSASSDFVDQGGFADGRRVIRGVADEGSNTPNLRHSNWWIKHDRLGRVTIGQQSNATDGIAELDLSRTTVTALSSVETWNEGFFLRDKDTGQAVVVAGIVSPQIGVGIVNDLFRGSLDGGRGNLVRYDSPTIGGFIASFAWGEDDDWDVALRYAGEFGAIQFVGGLGYHRGRILDTDNLTALIGGANNVPIHEEVVGSLSALHRPSGLFVTFAAGSREWVDVNQIGEDYIYVKSGFLRKWLPLGDTSIYGEFYKIWDVGITGAPQFDEEAEAWGIGVVQHIDAAAMELYLSYRRFQADDITDIVFNTDHDIQLDMVMAGGRVKF